MLQSFAGQWAALLTTYRRDGSAVPTPVNVAVDDGRIVFRTYAETGKFKRLRNDSRVTLQPCDARGRPTSELTLPGRARLLEGEADTHAGRLIDTKHPFFQGILVRTAHRLARYKTVHFEVLPAQLEGA